jgi:hypothetical protein
MKTSHKIAGARAVFQKWSLMPAALVGAVLAIEDRIPEMVRKHIAFRMMIVLERL